MTSTGSRKKNILVFPCGSEIGLTIYDAVKYSTYFHLVGLSSSDDHGRFVYPDYIGDAPNIHDEGIIEYLKKIIREKEIDAVYPTMDSVIERLKSAEAELGVRVVSSPYETARICLSKQKTYESLKQVVKTPRICSPEQVDSFPVFSKPDIGYSAKNTAVIKNSDELEYYSKKFPDNLLLEFLPGEEYTIDCFTDRHGGLLFCKARIRGRISNGISVGTRYVDGAEYAGFAAAINSRMRFRGAWFVQVKRAGSGELCLMEIAARFGGSSALSLAVGVNLPLLSLFDAFDYDVFVGENACSPVMDRALGRKYRCDLDFNTVYVDYDDCLVFRDRSLNHELISFLYQQIGRGASVILLTKHDGDLISELDCLRIRQLFDEIIHIPKGADKCEYISHPRSIFIDDSFKERENVRSRMHIAVFGPEMISVFL